MNFNNYTIKAQEVLQRATEIASGKGQQVIESGHLLKAILMSDENLISFLIKKMGATIQMVQKPLDEMISKYPGVSGGQPYLSNDATEALEKGEKCLKEFGDEYIAVEHIILGILLGSDKSAQILKNVGFQEKRLISAIKELRGGESVTDRNAESKYRSLERYSKNLNELAKKGKIDPVIGREEEIRRVLQILARRTKKNPILLGDSGVGKTAIVEGMARRIADGDVPENLKSKTIISLDMGLLVAGPNIKGSLRSD